VLKEKADSWHHGVSPPSHQTRLDSLLDALKALADGGLTAGCVLTNLHHRRIVPLMERPLGIFEMHEGADPIALAESRLLSGLFPRKYAATRARYAIDLRPGRNDDATLWAFTMLPIGPLVSGVLPFLVPPNRVVLACFEASFASPVLQIRAVNAARSDPPTPRSRAHARVAQQREQEWVARRRERSMRRRERRERRSEEFRLREQQGLSSPGTEEYSLSGEEEEEEEESDGGRAPPERWQSSPPSPRAVEAAEETVPAPATRQLMREATRAAEVPARAAKTAGGAAAAAPAAATTSVGPPRKRKRGFSTLR
jgi:hypothetical protein